MTSARRRHNAKMRAVRLRHDASASEPGAAPRSLASAAAEKVRDAVREARYKRLMDKAMSYYNAHARGWLKIFHKVHGRAPTSEDPRPAFDPLEWMSEDDRAWLNSLREKARDHSRQAHQFWKPDPDAADRWADEPLTPRQKEAESLGGRAGKLYSEWAQERERVFQQVHGREPTADDLERDASQWMPVEDQERLAALLREAHRLMGKAMELALAEDGEDA